MSKQAFKRVRRSLGLPVNREPLPAFAWPGGYPLLYVFTDGGCCCPECANKEINLIDQSMRDGTRDGWALGAVDVHWEGEPEICDHCGAEIESAYGIPDEA